MHRVAAVILVAFSLIVAAAGPSAADHRHHRGGIELFIGGPSVIAAPPYWYRPRPYVIYPAPTVVYESPAPPVFVPPPVWYYCRSYGAYYPTVPTCPEPWLLIPGR